ncbi:MAG: hypothetical protein R3D67_21090 [Hyphomicrobiaceae bacterium]
MTKKTIAFSVKPVPPTNPDSWVQERARSRPSPPNGSPSTCRRWLHRRVKLTCVERAQHG